MAKKFSGLSVADEEVSRLLESASAKAKRAVAKQGSERPADDISYIRYLYANNMLCTWTNIYTLIICSIHVQIFNGNLFRMLRGAIEEVDEILSRVEKKTAKPQEPCKPVREPHPPKKNRVFVVAPRTLQTPSGGSSAAKCPNGDDTSFSCLDVRIKQGKIKPNTTPAGDRQAEKEVKLVHAGVVATCDTPYPLEMGVMCLPLCYQ